MARIVTQSASANCNESLQTCQLYNKHTPNWNHSKYYPCCPFWQIFNKHQSHERWYKYKIRLLKDKRSMPVNTHHSNCSKIPHYQDHRNVIQRNVVGLKYFSIKMGNIYLYRTKLQMKDLYRQMQAFICQHCVTYFKYKYENMKRSRKDDIISQPWITCKWHRVYHLFRLKKVKIINILVVHNSFLPCSICSCTIESVHKSSQQWHRGVLKSWKQHLEPWIQFQDFPREMGCIL